MWGSGIETQIQGEKLTRFLIVTGELTHIFLKSMTVGFSHSSI